MTMDDSATCYHESGHAVVGFLLGGEVDAMSLGGEADEELPARFGECRIRWSENDARMLTSDARQAMTLLAGPVAEMISEGISWNPRELDPDVFAPWQMDFQCAMQAAVRLTGNESQAVILIQQILKHLDVYLRRDAVWAAVAELATELDAHETLDRDDVHHVLGHWLGRIG